MSIQKGQVYTRSLRGCIVEIEDDFSSSIFLSGGCTHSIKFVKNMIAEIVGIKMMSFERIWTRENCAGARKRWAFVLGR
jgi:hypothetical protein